MFVFNRAGVDWHLGKIGGWRSSKVAGRALHTKQKMVKKE